MNTPSRSKRLTEKSVYRFINRCRGEIRACERAGAYLAGIVLCGAALEYILSAWIRAFDIPRMGRKKLTEHWSLMDLNNRAYETGWLDDEAFRSAERIRKFRNLVHPNWYAGRKPMRFAKDVLEERQEDLNAAVDCFVPHSLKAGDFTGR